MPFIPIVRLHFVGPTATVREDGGAKKIKPDKSLRIVLMGAMGAAATGLGFEGLAIIMSKV